MITGNIITTINAKGSWSCRDTNRDIYEDIITAIKCLPNDDSVLALGVSANTFKWLDTIDHGFEENISEIVGRYVKKVRIIKYLPDDFAFLMSNNLNVVIINIEPDVSYYTRYVIRKYKQVTHLNAVGNWDVTSKYMDPVTDITNAYRILSRKPRSMISNAKTAYNLSRCSSSRKSYESEIYDLFSMIMDISEDVPNNIVLITDEENIVELNVKPYGDKKNE